MALPTGTLSMSQVNVELGRSSTALISLGETAVRGLAGVASGAIGMNSLRGKSSAFALTIASNQNNLNLRDYMLANGWDGSSPATVTVAAGVTISATTTNNYAMTIAGGFPGGLTLNNNGAIQGMGGAGGNGGSSIVVNNVSQYTAQTPGAAGGPGLLVQSAVSINNTGRIAGGGGGGAGGILFGDLKAAGQYVGGGGGGGRTSLSNSAGGIGGVAGGAVPRVDLANGSAENGTAGTSASAGNGGRGFVFISITGTASSNRPLGLSTTYGVGGSGGDWGASGQSLSAVELAGTLTSTGGAGGAALVGNSNITWIATGTRLGAIT